MALFWPLTRLLLGAALFAAGITLTFSLAGTSVPHPWRIPYGILLFALGTWALWRSLLWLARFVGVLPEPAAEANNPGAGRRP